MYAIWLHTHVYTQATKMADKKEKEKLLVHTEDFQVFTQID